MTFNYTIPALPVSDLTRSMPFYRDLLGLTLAHSDDGFAILRRDGIELHLWTAGDQSWRTRAVADSPVQSGAETFIAGTASCRIAVTGIDELYRTLEAFGIVHPNGRLSDRAWGTREFTILDPDHNGLTFFERR